MKQTLIASLMFALFGGATALGTESSPPNVVVFLVDDMGVMDTSVPFLTDAQGNPKRYPLNDYYRTPAMERLASMGIRLNNFYAMSVCSPTRISIMTGQNAAPWPSTPISDFVIEYYDGSEYRVIDKTKTKGNESPDWNARFKPITTTKLRLVVTKTPGDLTRIWEWEVYNPPAESP